MISAISGIATLISKYCDMIIFIIVEIITHALKFCDKTLTLNRKNLAFLCNGYDIEFYDDIMFFIIKGIATLMPKYYYVKLTLSLRSRAVIDFIGMK